MSDRIVRWLVDFDADPTVPMPVKAIVLTFGFVFAPVLYAGLLVLTAPLWLPAWAVWRFIRGRAG